MMRASKAAGRDGSRPFERRVLREAAATLKAPEAEIIGRVQALQEQIKDLKKGGSAKAQADVRIVAKALLAEAKPEHGVAVVVRAVENVASKPVWKEHLP